MKVNKVDHICIAVKNLSEACKVWELVLGKTKPDDSYVDEAEQIYVFRYLVGEIGFEIMESTSKDGPVAKWIEKHGEGIMLVSFNVNDTRSAVNFLQDKDYPFIPNKHDKVIRSFRDCEFAFIHPKKLNNVLTEIIDYNWEENK